MYLSMQICLQLLVIEYTYIAPKDTCYMFTAVPVCLIQLRFTVEREIRFLSEAKSRCMDQTITLSFDTCSSHFTANATLRTYIMLSFRYLSNSVCTDLQWTRTSGLQPFERRMLTVSVIRHLFTAVLYLKLQGSKAYSVVQLTDSRALL